MAVNIKLKRSAVPGNVPDTSQLELGELALNTYDGKVFFKQDDGTQSIVELASYTTGSTVASASYATYAATAGTADTASYVLNALSASFASTASYVVLAQTASYVLNALSASFASTASYVENAQTASYVLNALSASYAATASSADNFTVRGTLTAQTIIAQTITSSTEFITGSTKFGSNLTDTHQFTGSVTVSGSLAVNGVDYTNLSASFDTRISNNSSSISLLSGSYLVSSASFDTRILNNSSSIGLLSGSFLNVSASNSTRITALEAFSSSLDATFATDAELNYSSSILSGSIAVLSSSFEAFSGSFSTGSFTGSFKGSFTGSFSGSLNNFQGTARHIPFFSSSQVLADSSIYQVGTESVAINQNAVTTAAPEALYVWQPSTSSYNVISGKGNLDTYLQLNIQNTNQGPSASSDVVATANNGNETTNYIDMGINSENFSGFLGGPNDAYVYAAGNEFHIGNITPNKHLGFFVGGGDVDTGNKFALYPNNQHQMTGSLDVSGSVKAFSFTGSLLGNVTGSLFGTASWANNATSASYAFNATTASYVLNAVSASFASSGTGNFTGSFSGSFFGNGGGLTNISASSVVGLNLSQIASGSVTASVDPSGFKVNSNATISGSTQITGSLGVTGSVSITGSGTVLSANVDAISFTGSFAQLGSVTVVGSVNATSFTGSLLGTASFAVSASQAQNAVTASYVLNAVSSSFAATASSADNFLVRGTLTAQTIVAQTITSSIDFVTGSTRFGSLLSNTHQFTGSVGITGSLAINGVDYNTTSASFDTRILNNSASIALLSSSYLADSASFNTRINNNNASISSLSSSFLAFSGSYNTGSFTGSFTGSVLGNLTGTSSFASYAADANLLDGRDSSVFATTGSNIFLGNQTVTGSLFTTGSNTLIGSTTLTGSLLVSGSTTQIGNNTLIGNTSLTGSFKISGSETVTGYIQFEPVNTNIDNSISASYIYVSGSTNDLYFSQNGSGYANTTRLRWLEGNLYTGLLHGGLITVTTGSTTFNLSSGSGIVVDLGASLNDDPYPTIKYVNWNNFTNVPLTYLTSSIQSFIGIDDTGNIYQQNTAFNDGQYNTLITIGSVLHQNKSTVNASITYPNVAYGYKQRSYDFLKAFGPLKLSGLNIITSGSLGLNVGSGTAFADGRNYQVDPNNPSYITDPGTSVSKIFRYWQSGSEFVQDTNAGAGYTAIDPTQYNTGTALASVSPSTPWTNQRVFWYPNSATKGIVVYYGKGQYASSTEALANLTTETFLEVENTKQNAVYLGSITIKYNGVFTTPADYVISPAGIFRSVGGSGGGGSVVTTRLADLSDVLIAGPTSGQALVYDTTANKWENKSFISASISGNAATATSASIAATASYVVLAQTASYVENAQTASYILNAVSSSFASTASSADNFTVRGTLTAQTIVAQTITSSIDFVTGSTRFGSLLSNTHEFTGSVSITGSLNSPSITGSLLGTASFANNATSASYAFNATTASFALTSSYSNNILGAANYIPKFTGINTLSSSIMFENASGIGVNDVVPTHRFQVNGDALIYNSNSTLNTTKYALLPTLNVTTTGTETNQWANVGVYSSLGFSATSSTFTPLDKSFLSAFLGNVVKSGAGSVTGKMSSYAAASNFSGTGNVTTVAGFRAYAPLQSFAAPTFTGTVTNYIGLLIDDINGTTDIGSQITNRYGIFQSGSLDRNYFAGATIFANGLTGSLEGTASYAVTASYAMNAGSGGGGGLSALYIQDEGTTQGTASYIDFTGAGVVATVSNGTASINIPGGGGGGTGGSAQTFTQSIAANTWSFAHSVNSRTPIVEVYDSTYNVIIPTSIYNPGPFQTNIYFDVAQSGFAIISTGGVLAVSGSNAVLNQTSASTTWSFNHDLQTQYPVFTVYDSNNDVIIPQRINAVDTASAVIYFSTPRTGKAIASVGGNISFTSSSLSSSYALTASFASTALTSSYALTASYAANVPETASYALNALTASYALNAGAGAGFPYSGSAVVTGSLLVSGSGITGSLFGTASFAISASYATYAGNSPGTTVQFSQSVAAATWSFTHNLNTRNPIVQVYDTNYKQIIPNDIVGTGVNTAEVRFDYAQAGYVVMSNGGGLYVTGSTSELVQTVGATTWSFDHNLNSKYINFEVYDSNDYVIIPAGIRVLTTNSAELYFATSQTGRAVAQFSGINGAPNATTASYALTATSASYALVATSASFASAATSASYAATASYATNFTVASSLTLDATLTDYASVASSIVGSNNLFTLNTGSYTSAFFKYTVANGANTRAGEVIAAWNGTTTTITDFSTVDIGDTSAVTASVSIVSGQAQFNIQTNSSGWRIKSIGTFM